MESILIVEDDSHIKLGLEMNLRREGYTVFSAADGEEGFRLAMEQRPDLIVLDVMLPKLSGFEICKALRRLDQLTPILLLTAKNQEIDKIMGLELGADDYLTKPFSLRELIARIGAILRKKRAYEAQQDSYVFGRFKLDAQGQVLINTESSEHVELTQKEFELLRYFLQNEGRVLSRKQILNRVWGFDYVGVDRTVDNFINRLRSKIEVNPSEPKFLLTMRGAGYKFVTNGRPASSTSGPMAAVSDTEKP